METAKLHSRLSVTALEVAQMLLSSAKLDSLIMSHDNQVISQPFLLHLPSQHAILEFLL